LAGSKVFDSPRKSENRDVTDCPFAVVGVANESVICQSELRRAHARTSVLVAENSGLHRIDGEVV